jgi:hypothetical protein
MTINTAGPDYVESDKDSSKYHAEYLDGLGKAGAAEFTYYSHLKDARWQVEGEKLLPVRTEYGELHYEIQQGLRAAALAHEESFATRNLQLAVIKRLDRNRNYMIAILAALIYIASQLG